MIWMALVLASVGAGWLFGRGDATANLQAAAESFSQPILLALLGVTGGLYGRDRIRLRRSWPSPSLAYAGKLVFAAALAPAATFLFAPVDWPLTWLSGFAAGCGGGLGLWLSNLPLRL